jgi:N,N-dimethylformamidase
MSLRRCRQVKPVDHGSVRIAGYVDRLSARPGESVAVHASSVHGAGSLRLVRLGHDGERFTTEAVGSATSIELTHCDVVLGSYGVVDVVALPAAPVGLASWVWVTRHQADGDSEAALLAVDGMSLTLTAAGTVALDVAGERLVSTTALQPRRWYRLAGGLDAASRPVLTVRPARPAFDESATETVAGTETAATPWRARTSPLVFGSCFDGRLDEVCVSHDTEGDVLRLDLARGISSWDVHDAGGEVVGRVVGLPTRGVRGRCWTGDEHDWRHAPEHYGAIHFHTDDQTDQQWPVTATVELPDDVNGGVYALELQAGEDVDRVPFIVRPRQATAPLLVLLPTLTYLAYALHHLSYLDALPSWMRVWPDLNASFARANGFHSWYDRHRDDSPVWLCSTRRPLLNMRPDHRYLSNGSLHGLGADLLLIGWLERQGLAFDLACDHDLDAERLDLLRPYRAVVTGGHPEYISGRMYDALADYLDLGGSLAYLGGNGFLSVAAIDPSDASVAEMRRGHLHGVNFPYREIGEDRFQLTGTPTGNMYNGGRPSGALIGVTWASQAMGGGAPFRRTPASFDPRVAHLFAGIGDDELLGEHGAIYGVGASFETDLADPAYGSPAHALVLATAELPEQYMEVLATPGIRTKNVRRADITYYETRAGGAVFAAGSIGWNGALVPDHDGNAASRLTANVLRSFIGD